MTRSILVALTGLFLVAGCATIGDAPGSVHVSSRSDLSQVFVPDLAG